MKQGIIQVYTGDGKGKTTAAMGLAVRAWGRGLKVKVFQLLKAAGSSGEHWSFMVFDPPLPIHALGSGEFIFNREPTRDEIQQTMAAWEQIDEAIGSGLNDVIVIDELSHAINKGLLSLDMVITTLTRKPNSLEVVLTGRDMPAAIIEMADLVTEMKMLKHPFQRGLEAREGIEF